MEKYQDLKREIRRLWKLRNVETVPVVIWALGSVSTEFDIHINIQAVHEQYMIIPSLLLQKPTRNSKAKDHTKKLEERLSNWKGG